MERLLFVITSFNCGGINRSLQNLLPYLKDKLYNFELEILVLNPEGQYQNEYQNYKLHSLNKYTTLCIKNLKKTKGFKRSLVFLLKVINRLTNDFVKKRGFSKIQKKISLNNYSAIIAFAEDLPTYFVSGINHPNKIAWIHCDFASLLKFPNKDKNIEEKYYRSFRKIVNVSEYTNQSFIKIFPNYTEKSVAIHNVLDTNYMKRMAKLETDEKRFEDYSGFRIVTVGRIDFVKNQSIIPGIAHKLKEEGNDFKWYIIGPEADPVEYRKLNEAIEAYGLEDNVILLGEQKNPYPYISKANILVNTSVSEACPYVINEAKILGTPVLCRDFGSATEFISNGIDGFIEKKENFANKLSELLSDSKLLAKIRANLNDFEYNNDLIINDILNLITHRESF